MRGTARPVVGGFADNIADPWGGGVGRKRKWSDETWRGFWETDRSEAAEKEERIRTLQKELESERSETAKKIRDLENAFSTHGPGSGYIVLGLADEEKAIFRNLLTGFGD